MKWKGERPAKLEKKVERRLLLLFQVCKDCRGQGERPEEDENSEGRTKEADRNEGKRRKRSQGQRHGDDTANDTQPHLTGHNDCFSTHMKAAVLLAR